MPFNEENFMPYTQKVFN